MEFQNHPDTQERITAWLVRPERPSGMRDFPELGTCLATNIGTVREENQDRVIAARYLSARANESFFLVAIADGIGGLKDGGRCASYALSVLITSMLCCERAEDIRNLVSATNAANMAVFERYRERGGTTLNTVLFTRRGMTACSVGDSRLYGLSRGSLAQISEDDSIGAELGRIRPELSKSVDVGGFGNHLTQYIGMGPGLEPHVYRVVKDASSLVLATDGIHRIATSVLNDIASNARNRLELANRLINVANWIGGKDNASVAAISIESTHWIEDSNQPGSGNLEMWDSFGKYELAFAAIPEKEKSAIAAEEASLQREAPQGAKVVHLKKKRERKPERKQAVPGDVQISFVDYPLPNDQQKTDSHQESGNSIEPTSPQNGSPSPIAIGSGEDLSQEKHGPGADREQSK